MTRRQQRRERIKANAMRRRMRRVAGDRRRTLDDTNVRKLCAFMVRGA